MKYLYIILAFCMGAVNATATQISGSFAWPTSYTSNNSSGFMVIVPLTLGSAGTIQSASVCTTSSLSGAAVDCNISIYQNVSGAGGDKLYDFLPVSASSAGWHTATAPSFKVLPAGSYYLVYSFTNANARIGYSALPGNVYYQIAGRTSNVASLASLSVATVTGNILGAFLQTDDAGNMPGPSLGLAAYTVVLLGFIGGILLFGQFREGWTIRGRM